MHALIDLAWRRGLKTMEGTVLAANSAMLKFMRQLGFRRERSVDDPQTVRVLRSL
jgi:RimJ/RimL family protein N-acetyltransferase